MKKPVAMLILIVMASAMLFANGKVEKAPLEESKVLKIFVPQSPGVPQGMEALAKAYMEKNPDTQISVRSVPFGKYKEQLTVMWSSDEVDDIIMSAVTDAPTNAYFGSLLPLDDILDVSQQGLFVPSVIETATYEGHLYAYPFRESCSAMYYNKEYFALAGIEPATLENPWTWSQWKENILAVRDAVEKKNGQRLWGLTFLSNPGAGDFWITPIIRSNGVKGSNTYKAISPDGMTLTGYADTPEAMEAYAFYQDLYQKDNICSLAEVPDAFATGQSITMISFLATASQLNSKFPDLSWGLMPLPYFKTPLTHTGGFAISVSAKTKVPNLAKDFVKFAGSEEGLVTYFKTSGVDLVSRIGFAEKHPELYAKEAQQFFLKNLEMYGEARPITPGYTLYNAIIGFDMFEDIVSGADIEKTVKDKIKIFENQMKNL
ncbi:ABC-type sugar transport system, periplasmic component [Sphaerochaeta pleomorpha str. Grapes]|uniref:ABC-type sugar transport system, periplasmic component n=1 Tax=Sphaerochaeta pleomorpha (strain ATCC BAA-1885 / DSM 22778 / Grapes) TaxID=158190 RepID=G8QWS6_SPHPG|nr:extracellular solute-binding protein [Sphaerochaeta pleomorpha]AEV28370.1 ABC-type sugar transport system, periplasmic component [Sphaerochaeta pleomorpha str. Grapes]